MRLQFPCSNGMGVHQKNTVIFRKIDYRYIVVDFSICTRHSGAHTFEIGDVVSETGRDLKRVGNISTTHILLDWLP